MGWALMVLHLPLRFQEVAKGLAFQELRTAQVGGERGGDGDPGVVSLFVIMRYVSELEASS